MFFARRPYRLERYLPVVAPAGSSAVTPRYRHPGESVSRLPSDRPRLCRSSLKERGWSRMWPVFSVAHGQLLGRVEVGVGVKARAELDRAAAGRALTPTPLGACLCGCRGLLVGVGLSVRRCGGRWSHHGRGSRSGEQAGRLLGHPFAAPGGAGGRRGRMMGSAEDGRGDGRSGSIRGLDRAARGGGHDLHGLAADRRGWGSHAAAPRGRGGWRARTWWSRRA
jgi:hypothetical protein